MSDIEARILKLAKLIGICTEGKSKELAELKAYAKGFELISGDLAQTALQLSPETAQCTALALFCDIMGIDYSLSDTEKREQIKNGFLMDGINYTNGEFEKQLEAAHFNAVLSAGKLTISATSEKTKEDYKKLAQLMKNYTTPNLYITFDGDGITFDEWAGMDFMFDEFDKLNFPFSMLDTIKTEEL